MKIKGRLKLSRGDEIRANVFSVFRKQILDYINEIEVSICKLEMFFPSEGREEIESDWLVLQLTVHKELKEFDSSLLPPETSPYLD